MKKVTYIVNRCKKCNEPLYKFKKGERPSDLVLGAEMWLHLLVCDRDKFDEHLERAWNS
tara:strand:+ start:259 stop:435 length:177 start_codon:yes stop_codon:yes gene_type:complete